MGFICCLQLTRNILFKFYERLQRCCFFLNMKRNINAIYSLVFIKPPWFHSFNRKIQHKTGKCKKKIEDIILSQKFAKILRSEILKLFFSKMWFKQKNESIKQKIMMKIIGRQDKYFEQFSKAKQSSLNRNIK